MSDRPDEQYPLKHLLDDGLLEELDIRIHPGHIDMYLPESLLLRLIPIRLHKVLVHQFQVVDPFPFQHRIASFQGRGQVSGEESPGDWTHPFWHPGPTELLQLDQVEQGFVQEEHKLLRLGLILHVLGQVGGQLEELRTTRVGVQQMAGLLSVNGG